METSASILVKGVKQRFYFNDTVFLPNDTEFEIEFFNKSSRTVCPDITINGEHLKSSPVVYNAQKFILKDFIEVNKKLLFRIYKVDANDEDVKKAIKENGVISIKYYYEKIEKDTDRIFLSVDITSDISEDLNKPIGGKPHYAPSLASSPKTMDTGKIMKGSDSGMKYKDIEIELDFSVFETQIIKILPESKKPGFFNCPKCNNSSKIDANYCEICGFKY